MNLDTSLKITSLEPRLWTQARHEATRDYARVASSSNGEGRGRQCLCGRQGGGGNTIEGTGEGKGERESLGCDNGLRASVMATRVPSLALSVPGFDAVPPPD